MMPFDRAHPGEYFAGSDVGSPSLNAEIVAMRSIFQISLSTLRKISTQKSKFDTRIKVAQFSMLIPNLRSKLVNSVGKVKNKGVLASKTWFLASKVVKMIDLTGFDHRFGFRIENWTKKILVSNYDFWVENFLSVEDKLLSKNSPSV